ncbi:hypothetical protein [Enterocloster sp.]|uniref:hypothetical protein n=1 Tax=Enterocloster sp. TaxID=2719315 RepID=UPI0039A2B929
MEKGKRGRKMAERPLGRKRMITAVLAVILAIYTWPWRMPEDREVPETSQRRQDRLQIGLSFESCVIERCIRERDVFVPRPGTGADVNVQNANGDAGADCAD